ncbi:MAG: 4Fe-4S dicluster domain-containing protein [Candidatus Aminicenantes bacterium]|nr:4Fe-4S dicluster domain-containing protein [Candidatus Aminicenantes bacterium]
MKKESWKELTLGTINLDAGNSVKNLTGTWRSGKKPQFIEERCIQCFFCWLYCPHFAIEVDGDKVRGINYDYCTGCGICSVECPTKEKAIVMVKEEVKLFEERAK